jgi:hypothetical protein
MPHLGRVVNETHTIRSRAGGRSIGKTQDSPGLSGHQLRVAGMVQQGGSAASGCPDAVGATITALPGIMKVAYPPGGPVLSPF